jgi:hypothetical protein
MLFHVSNMSMQISILSMNLGLAQAFGTLTLHHLLTYTQRVCFRVINDTNYKHVSMPPTTPKERVSNVHEVNNNKTQLLYVSHNHVWHNHTFCIIKYTYRHIVFYMFLRHLNLVLPILKAGYIHLPPKLACTTYTNPRSYLG